MVYSAKFEADGSLFIITILGLLGILLLIIGIIFLVKGALSLYQDYVDTTYYQPPRHHPRIRDREEEGSEVKSFCPYCGAKLSHETRYCTSCGKRIF
ncbi:MAG: zinc ribbon domain-containing protein [Methanocorpusculum sp.]|nr:zinc ribbon domain-containing protein [Methanocorpusculum sp.]